MRVLIVESEHALAKIWEQHLQRMGMEVTLVHGQSGAIKHLVTETPDIIVLDVMLTEGSAFAVADYASYRMPDTQIIFVTSASFFSDGSIFSFAANACAFVQRSTPPDDLVAMVEHYGGTGTHGQPPR